MKKYTISKHRLTMEGNSRNQSVIEKNKAFYGLISTLTELGQGKG
jgi:hypothetical protein